MRFLAGFALLALAEVATFFWVGSQIGLGWALGMAVITALLGAVLVRRAGLSALRRIRAKLNQGELPGRDLSDGAAILVSGAFLITPGFITDTLGFLLLVPAVRALIYRILSRRVSARVNVFASNWPTTDRSVDPADEIIDVDSWE
jgi:UPF0716 protein FxsA